MPQSGNQRSSSGSTGSSLPIWAFSRSSRSLSRRWAPPAGFERFFEELVDLGGVARSDPAVLGELCERYALDMDPSSVPGLVDRFGVRFPGEPLA